MGIAARRFSRRPNTHSSRHSDAAGNALWPHGKDPVEVWCHEERECRQPLDRRVVDHGVDHRHRPDRTGKCSKRAPIGGILYARLVGSYYLRVEIEMATWEDEC